MSDYPAFAQIIGSQQDWVDDLVTDVAVNGRPMSRAFYTTKKRVFKLVHLLSASELSTFETFYDTFRLDDSFTMRWMCNGPEYNVMFDSVPRIQWANPLSRVEVTLRKVD
jgi:hypothetical protein